MQCPKCHYKRTSTDEAPDWQCPKCSIAYAKFDSAGKKIIRKYIPNVIPENERQFNIFASIGLFLYGSYGLYVNDLYIRARRGRGIHFHDESAFLLYLAIICACMVMLSVVIDHYDQRDNEHKYREFGIFMKWVGWLLFMVALVYGSFHHQTNN